ncbi:MAG: CBS domain-containing protein [Xanthomonadales bacterium]|nr:CBS domain-containing protein [Xanthomonadales bacterium]
MLSVREFMTPQPKTLSRYNTLADARRAMAENRCRHIPIVDEDGKLIGLVSQRDILRQSIPSQDQAEPEELAEIESGTLLADLMTTRVTTVGEEMSIADAAHLAHKRKHGCLPVVDENDRLEGIITDHDFVAIVVQLLDMMAEEEPPEDEV